MKETRPHPDRGPGPSVRLRLLITGVVALIGIGFVLLLSASGGSDEKGEDVVSSGSALTATEAAKKEQAKEAARDAKLDQAFEDHAAHEESVERAGGHNHLEVRNPATIMAVAEKFSAAFTEYETGRPSKAAEKNLVASAGALLIDELTFAPARVPLNAPKPEPASIEWYSEPSAKEVGGMTTYTVSVRFHREESPGALARTFVMTLFLAGEGDDLRVFDIQGGE